MTIDPFIGDRQVCGAYDPSERQELSPYHVAVAALAECGRVDLVAALFEQEDRVAASVIMLDGYSPGAFSIIARAIRMANDSIGQVPTGQWPHRRS